VPIAHLVPIESSAEPDVKHVIEAILKIRNEHPLNGEDLKEWISEGRRL
jgi:hypothetical protein